MGVEDDEIAALQAARKGTALGAKAGGEFDRDLYGGSAKGYSREVVEEAEDDEAMADVGASHPATKANARFAEHRAASGRQAIAERESEYQKRGRALQRLSPERGDVFADKTPARSYKDVMQSQNMDHERDALLKKIADGESLQQEPEKKKRRWDDSGSAAAAAEAEAVSRFQDTPGFVEPRFESTPATDSARWDSTPGREVAAAKASRWMETPARDDAPAKAQRWDSTPTAPVAAESGGKRSRWDEAPMVDSGAAGGATPVGGFGGATPLGLADAMTPTPTSFAAQSAAALALDRGPVTPEMAQRMRWEREMNERNRPLSDAELDMMFPANGYKILDPPAGYAHPHAGRKLTATPTPLPGSAGALGGFSIANTPKRDEYGVPATPNENELPTIKPEDYQYFSRLMEDVDEDGLSKEEAMELKIMRLLLKVKNGTPPQRKTALRQITDKAREFGAGSLFNQILPLLMSPTLEDQERHLLVKVIDRILYKLDDLVRPFVHKILVVIEPLLIDEDYYARRGREIISNLAKAAGLATMIATMRPDIDNLDEYVRNTTARAFAVVASALGIPALLPFLKAVCQSRKSWQARHTGIKIVQQIAILMGCAVLPHLRQMVEIIEHGLVDDQQKPLWKGIRHHRGKGLAAFLKAIGFIIPLMDSNYANYYTREVMIIVIREFQSPDEEMKKIVLKVVKQCVATDGVEASYVRGEILPEFFRNFWVRRMALDRRNYKQVVETTVELANKVGAAEIVARVCDDLKDESEPYRRMVMETIEHEQASDDTEAMLSGFGVVVNALGLRTKPYLPQICGTIKWRLNNKAANVRMQAADLIARIAVVMRQCQEDQLMGHLGVVLYEYLGEEYPEVLGSILGALKAIVNVIGMSKMTPPIKDLLPRLTPILKNRHEKVQENCIDLVGRIADRGAEFVAAEWMRICFELLEMLKAHKKAIRRAAVNTFGYIAKAIGPQDVLHTLLNNLKVQERQNRVCTTVAIGIVAETCAPFTVLPALLNEYRVPELNVQNGVLKALSFMFEYIGEMGKDYTACAAIKHLALGVAGLGCEDALVHLMNHAWPNASTSPRAIAAVFEAIEGFMVSLGVPVVLNYALQGLYHPARRVRDVYWKIYNSLYTTGARHELSEEDMVFFEDPVDSDLIFGEGRVPLVRESKGLKLEKAVRERMCSVDAPNDTPFFVHAARRDAEGTPVAQGYLYHHSDSDTFEAFLAWAEPVAFHPSRAPVHAH
ncbi:hypothetical protein JL721_6553 [Aureococcus anophagefferens]|nr:hypothetical protein JL721_6553 [Aureococcus anophagefferens]